MRGTSGIADRRRRRGTNGTMHFTFVFVCFWTTTPATRKKEDRRPRRKTVGDPRLAPSRSDVAPWPRSNTDGQEHLSAGIGASNDPLFERWGPHSTGEPSRPTLADRGRHHLMILSTTLARLPGEGRARWAYCLVWSFHLLGGPEIDRSSRGGSGHHPHDERSFPLWDCRRRPVILPPAFSNTFREQGFFHLFSIVRTKASDIKCAMVSCAGLLPVESRHGANRPSAAFNHGNPFWDTTNFRSMQWVPEQGDIPLPTTGGARETFPQAR